MNLCGSRLAHARPTLLRNILNTLYESSHWCYRHYMAAFPLKVGPSSLYLILPPKYLGTYQYISGFFRRLVGPRETSGLRGLDSLLVPNVSVIRHWYSRRLTRKQLPSPFVRDRRDGLSNRTWSQSSGIYPMRLSVQHWNLGNRYSRWNGTVGLKELIF